MSESFVPFKREWGESRKLQVAASPSDVCVSVSVELYDMIAAWGIKSGASVCETMATRDATLRTH